MVKKTKKVTTKKIAHKTDWKFLSIIAALTIIGVGVFLIFRGLAAQNPEIFYGYPRGHHLNAETQKANGGSTPGNNTNGGAGGSTRPADIRFNAVMNGRAADNRDRGSVNCVGKYDPATGRCK